MSAALLNGPGRKSANRGSTYAHWWTQRPTSVRPHAVSPKSYSYSGAAAMTIRYTGIGSFIRQRAMVLGGLEPSTGASPRRAPFAMTLRRLGARTVQLTVALSLGWSTLGIQWRPRSGQLSAKAVHPHVVSLRMMRPSVTGPP